MGVYSSLPLLFQALMSQGRGLRPDEIKSSGWLKQDELAVLPLSYSNNAALRSPLENESHMQEQAASLMWKRKHRDRHSPWKTASQTKPYICSITHSLPLVSKGQIFNNVIWECTDSIFLMSMPKSRCVFLASASSCCNHKDQLVF